MCNHMRWLSLAILLTGLTMIGSQTSGTGDATLAPTELPQAPPTTIPPPPRPSTAPILPPVTPSPRQDRLTTTTPRVTQKFARLPSIKGSISHCIKLLFPSIEEETCSKRLRHDYVFLSAIFLLNSYLSH